MKLSKIINAYRTLEILSDIEALTQNDQWNIYKLRSKLRTHIEFEQEQEKKIREKYIPFANEKGELNSEDTVKYMADMQKLVDMDVEIEEFTKPTIHFVKGINCKITDPLEDFIEFTEPAE